MSTVALIVAAGRGSRMARDMPKQYLPLEGHMVLWHTVSAFLASAKITGVLVVIHPDDRALYEAAVQGLEDPRLMAPVPGGASRAQSVCFGLAALAQDPPEHVLIHDAARPFCSPNLIAAVIAALQHAEGAFVALPVVDALWRVEDGCADVPVSRDGLWRAQTPQAFRYEAICRAHAQGDETAADDVEIARQMGLSVQIVEGDEDNFKITLPRDLQRAEQVLKTRQL